VNLPPFLGASEHAPQHLQLPIYRGDLVSDGLPTGDVCADDLVRDRVEPGSCQLLMGKQAFDAVLVCFAGCVLIAPGYAALTLRLTEKNQHRFCHDLRDAGQEELA
jgi:hypothetical protein